MVGNSDSNESRVDRGLYGGVNFGRVDNQRTGFVRTQSNVRRNVSSLARVAGVGSVAPLDALRRAD